MDLEVLFSWQTYVALGLGLIIFEAFVSTFFLFPLGVSLLLVAIIAPFVNLEIELITFGVLSVINFYVSLKFLKPHFMGKKQLTGVDSLVGRVVSVFEEINEEANTGQVKVYADQWKALPTEMGQVIPKNDKVIIDRIDGNKVFVSKV